MMHIRSVLRPSLAALLVLVLTAGYVFLQSRSLLDRPYNTWAAFDSIWGTVPALLFPVLAAVSSALALRRARPGSIVMMPSGATPVFVRVMVIHIPFVLSAVLGVILGIAPVGVFTATTATSGGPDVTVIILFFGQMLLAILLGLVAALLVRSVVAVLVAFAITMLWGQVANYFGDNWWMVAPFRPYPQVPGQSLSTGVALGSAVFILVAGGLLVLTAWALSRAPRAWGRAAVGLLGTVASVLVMAIVGRVSGAELWQVDAEPPRECRETDQFAVCFHQAHRADLDNVEAGANSVIDNYGDALAYRPVIIDKSLLLAPSQIAPEVMPVLVEPGHTDRIAAQLAQNLSGFWACANNPDPEHTTASGELERWLLEGPRSENPEAELGAMQEFIRSNREAIESCTLKPEDLPLR